MAEPRQLELNLNLCNMFVGFKVDKRRKKCAMCGETMYIYLFRRDRRTIDGHSGVCLWCDKKLKHKYLK